MRQIAQIKRFADINLADKYNGGNMSESTFEWNGYKGYYHEYKGTETHCSNPHCGRKFQDGDIVTKTSYYDDKIVCRYKCEVWYEELVKKTNCELSPYVFFTKKVIK
jgi:hypothetical protein